MQKRDSERHLEIDLDQFAFDYLPTLGGNLIHSTPWVCFSRVTGVHNLIPRIGKQVKVCIPQLVEVEAEGKLSWAGFAKDIRGPFVWIESLSPKEIRNPF